jgi:hypothetical protein
VRRQEAFERELCALRKVSETDSEKGCLYCNRLFVVGTGVLTFESVLFFFVNVGAGGCAVFQACVCSV